jgi:hypothetical protein
VIPLPCSRAHPADSRNLKAVSKPPTHSPIARIRDLILIPMSDAVSSEELLRHRPAGQPPVRLSPEMTLERLPPKDSELIRAACLPRGHFFYQVHQGGFYYAYIWELPQRRFEDRPGWDPASELYPALAYSRLIVDNGHTTEYAARLIDYEDGAKQVLAAVAHEAAIAFRADPSLRDWMDASEAADLAALLSKVLGHGAAKVTLPDRLLRANWVQEYAIRVRYGDLALPLLVTALEALLHTAQVASTKQFKARVAKLAADVELPVLEDWCAMVYDARSSGVHGKVTSAFSYEESATGLEYVSKIQMILRRAIRRAIDDPSFRATFESDDTVREYCPVIVNGKSV